MIPECIRHTRKAGLQAVHATKPFIVKHHIFLADAPFFTQRGNQLWCPGKQQAKGSSNSRIIHIQQCNTQPFFWPGLCLPALLQNILPLLAKTGRFAPFCKTVFIRQINCVRILKSIPYKDSADKTLSVPLRINGSTDGSLGHRQVLP